MSLLWISADLLKKKKTLFDSCDISFVRSLYTEKTDTPTKSSLPTKKDILLLTYDSIPDLIEKIDYYLEHEE